MVFRPTGLDAMLLLVLPVTFNAPQGGKPVHLPRACYAMYHLTLSVAPFVSGMSFSTAQCLHLLKEQIQHLPVHWRFRVLQTHH